MLNIHRFLTFSFILVLFSNTALATSSKPTPQINHTGVFGIIVKDQQGKENFQVTNTVPLLKDQSYGWVIRLDPTISKTKWKEVFELPTKPKTWGAGEEEGMHDISENRTTSITERDVIVEDGYIQNFWKVAAGDPTGDYIIRVYVNDVLLETFKFKVVEPKEFANQ